MGGDLRLPRSLVLVLLMLLTTFSAGAADRVALVIGNSDYRNVAPLSNATNDADAIGASLARIGFQVQIAKNIDKVQFEELLANFSDTSTNADLAIVYYAGHGVEVDGINYLIPSDAKLTTVNRVPFETVSLNDMLLALRGARGLKLVMLDACRNNPFQLGGRDSGRSVGFGLAPVEVPRGVLVSYAAAAGTIANDGAGKHSPYAAAVLQHLETPNLDVGLLFRRVADSVQEATAGRQVPYEYGRLPGQAIFLSKQAPTVGTAVEEPPPEVASSERSVVQPPGAVVSALSSDKDEENAPALRKARPDNHPRISAPKHQCDELAANRNDPGKIPTVDGVYWGLIDGTKASEACRSAVKDFPDELRFQYQLGRALYRTGATTEAVATLKRAANAGYGAAHGLLGAMYSVGDGVAQSHAEAARLWRKGSDLGNVAATVALSGAYWDGRGVTRNRKTATQLAKIVDGKSDEFSIFVQGNIHANGVGRSIDLARAIELYETAARLGSIEAMNMLGWRYETGKGVAKDLNTALGWYQKSSALGDGEALGKVATFYDKGLGVGRDPERAAVFFLRAIATRNPAVVTAVQKHWRGFTRETRVALQKHLIASVGYSGELDGQWGPKVRLALEQLIRSTAPAFKNVLLGTAAGIPPNLPVDKAIPPD